MFKTPKGKIVYGGGGIIPDEYIPVDSVGYGRWYYENAHRDIFNTQIFKYIEENHASLQKIKEEHFLSFYKTDQIAKELLSRIGYRPDHFAEKDMDNFRTFIKATMARFLYGETAYDRVWNQKDPMTQKAIEIYNNSL